MSKCKGYFLPTSLQGETIVPKTKYARKSRCITLVILAAVTAIYYYFFSYNHHVMLWKDVNNPSVPTLCPQMKGRTPQRSVDLYVALSKLYHSEEFVNRVVNRLSGAIQIRTETNDTMGPVDEDPQSGWKAFSHFHDYLFSAYPLIHSTLRLTKINTYGLVYHWQGTDRALKPLLFAAHQDVVPVNPSTFNQWVHPPYSGFYDGTYVWGRGSADDKGGLIGVMSAVETLLSHGFEPRRTIVLAFGFDEEIGGRFGAYEMNKYLLQYYGENGFALLLDEGGGMFNAYGAKIITPGTAENGYLDVSIQVNTPGGHSSRPPEHTSIGFMSTLLVALEENSPKPHLSRDHIAYNTIQCFVHTPDIPESLLQDIILSRTSDKALLRVEEQILSTQPAMRYSMATTQAIDVIHGGTKANVLPEETKTIINHRIDTASSVVAEKERISSLLQPVAERYNLSFTSFGEVLLKSSAGSVVLSETAHEALEPAPKTPTDRSGTWSLFSASLRAAIDESGIPRNKIVIAPGLTTGNTDTKHYWKLTPHIFRYSYGVRENALYPGGFVHTVNEAASALNIVDGIRFVTTLILNADEWNEGNEED